MVIHENTWGKDKKPTLKYLHLASLYLFALLGFLFFAVFVAIRLKLTNVSGAVDTLSSTFNQNYKQIQVLGAESSKSSSDGTSSGQFGQIDDQINQLFQKKEQLVKYLCGIDALSTLAPKNIEKIITAHKKTDSVYLANQMVFALKPHLDNQDFIDNQISKCTANFSTHPISEDSVSQYLYSKSGQNIISWTEYEEWEAIKTSIAKDKDVIIKASKAAKIEPRLVVSSLVVEQLRLYYSQRELFKKFFEPLKILANANKFSLGVMSIKEDTAINIENHLKDSSSPYYLGKDLENILDYDAGINISEERYNRLTSNNHFSNYLYGALYLNQFVMQWSKEGYDLTKRPEILATLFNVGFNQSHPNPEPQVGGANITLNNDSYSFGRLAYEFYYSGEMMDIFPYTKE